MKRRLPLCASLLFLSCRVEPQPAPPLATTIKFAVAGSSGLPSFGETPFPDDQYRDADGTLSAIPGFDEVVSRNEQVVVNSIDQTTGFGLTSAIYFFTDGDISSASLPQTPEESLSPVSSVFLQDVTNPGGERIPAEVRFLPDTEAIVVLPRQGVVLKENSRYLAAVTTLVLTPDGIAKSDPDFLKLFAEGASLSAEEQSTRDRLQDAFTVAGVSSSELLAATVFTTGAPTQELQAAADIIRQGSAPRVSLDPGDPTIAPFTVAAFSQRFTANDPGNHPSLLASLDDLLGSPQDDSDGVDFPGLDNNTGLAHDSLGLVLSGVYFGPSFQRADTGTDGPEDETFLLSSGAPQVIEAERPLPFTLILPDPALVPMPPGGYPVVIATHGLGNSRRFLFSFANDFARRGVAVIGIDLSGHGSRFEPLDVQNTFFSNGAYEGPDGLGDTESNGIDQPATRLFEGFSNLLGARDNLRQSALDLVALHQSIEAGLSLGGFENVMDGTTILIDGSKVAYLGNSLGTIVGTLFLALTPEIKVAALNVAGAGFANNIVAHSPNIGQLFGFAVLLVFGSVVSDDALDRFHPLLNISQTLFDATDPMAFASRLQDRNILLLEVIDDETMPNQSSRALAEALGLELLGPVGVNALREEPGLVTTNTSSGNQGALTRLLLQIAPATHSDNIERRFGTRNRPPNLPLDGDTAEQRFPSLPESIEIEQPIRAVHQTLIGFFESGFAGVPVVNVFSPPVSDFDADGFCDAEETSTDPLDPESTPGGQGSCERTLP